MSIQIGVADDQLRPAFANLARATGDVTKSQELLTLSTNISAATGKDLESVSIALSKAYGGNVAGLSVRSFQDDTPPPPPDEAGTKLASYSS